MKLIEFKIFISEYSRNDEEFKRFITKPTYLGD